MVAILELLDHLPVAIRQSPGLLWSVLARSLGEQGGAGRTALAWRWALTGECPSPVTLSQPVRRAPDRSEVLAEASAQAELAGPGSDPGGQVMHARLVLEWLAGDLDAVPLWNAGPGWPHVTDGAAHIRDRGEIEEVYSWSILAREWNPWSGEAAETPALRAARVARGLPAYPLKVTVTVSGDLDPELKFWHYGGGKLVYCPDSAVAKVQERLGPLAEVAGLGETLDFGAMLDDLGERGIGRLMVEGGGTTHTQFLTAGLADEIHLAVAPFFVGNPDAPRFVNPGSFPYGPSRRMALVEAQAIGDIALLRYVLDR